MLLSPHTEVAICAHIRSILSLEFLFKHISVCVASIWGLAVGWCLLNSPTSQLLYFPAGGTHRLLQHHYAFNFFADPKMQSFYKRFIRDFMRYQVSG
jgi:hypothetical protein